MPACEFKEVKPRGDEDPCLTLASSLPSGALDGVSGWKQFPGRRWKQFPGHRSLNEFG